MATTTMHAASRDALAAAEHRLDGVLGGADANPATVGEELFAFARLLRGEISLRRAVADPAASEDARKNLVRSLLGSQVGDATLQVLDVVAGSRWSNPRELLDGVRALGASAMLAAAERDGTLKTVEDELFGVARTVANNAELDRALSDQSGSVEAKRELARRIFGEHVNAVTLALIEQVAGDPKGRGVEKRLDELSELAARRREQSVAHVITASPLTEEQRDALSAKLNRIYGKQITLHAEVKPGVLGGIVVKVGDEVIDGSSAGRIMALRGQLA